MITPSLPASTLDWLALDQEVPDARATKPRGWKKVRGVQLAVRSRCGDEVAVTDAVANRCHHNSRRRIVYACKSGLSGGVKCFCGASTSLV